MATRVINDSKLQDIAVAIQNKDGGGQMTVDEMPTRIEQNLQSKAVLDSVIDGSITSIESDVTDTCGSVLRDRTNLISVSLPYATILRTAALLGCSVLTDVYIPNVRAINGSAFGSCISLVRILLNTNSISTNAFNSCRSLITIVIHSRSSLSAAGANTIPSQTTIYVQPEDLSWYSTATNWSTLYADNRIKSIEDLTGDDLAWYQEQLARYQAQTA